MAEIIPKHQVQAPAGYGEIYKHTYWGDCSLIYEMLYVPIGMTVTCNGSIPLGIAEQDEPEPPEEDI